MNPLRFFAILILAFYACSPTREFNSSDPGTKEYWMELFLGKVKVPFFSENEGTLQWAVLNGSAGFPTIGLGLAVDANGFSYVAGNTSTGIFIPSPIGTLDLILSKYDSGKNLIWGVQIGAVGSSITVTGIAIDPFGNSYVTGFTNISFQGPLLSGQDTFVVKFDTDGNKVWGTQLGPVSSSYYTTPTKIAVDIFGNSYVIGTTNGPFGGSVSSGINGYIFKLNANGAADWIKQNAITSVNYNSEGIAFDRITGTIYMVGFGGADFETETVPSIGTNDLFIVKHDPADGTRLFFAQLGMAGREIQSSAIATDGFGNVYAGGMSNADFGSNADGSAYLGLIVKYDFAGNRQWIHQFGASITTRVLALSTDAGGNVFATGYTQSDLISGSGPSIGGTDLFITKYDRLGQKEWVRQYGETLKAAQGSGIQSDFEGNLYCAGSTSFGFAGIPAVGTQDMFLLKFR
ncbi:SBBP repeat-containing protein [Leptospira ellisii]|uniref:SBBP repeat-containing protein n=1 Tax=Leptospira ellisii TaxID=2023197 RepID=A0A2N0BDY7_9LEPT|nr:SBBP repeat-containing protein [Leptospira ellisii]MDV6235507.1 SBBP repeat-containing protein [Leptospira ellisii]PJZ94754.1 hypothetical protein CH379_01035 [Leptospira ellisii]PKA05492.1 hypothetical protein CH375_04855 [Leptospira ellisii]